MTSTVVTLTLSAISGVSKISDLKNDEHSYYSGWVRDLRVKLSGLESEEHS